MIAKQGPEHLHSARACDKWFSGPRASSLNLPLTTRFILHSLRGLRAAVAQRVAAGPSAPPGCRCAMMEMETDMRGSVARSTNEGSRHLKSGYVIENLGDLMKVAARWASKYYCSWGGNPPPLWLLLFNGGELRIYQEQPDSLAGKYLPKAIQRRLPELDSYVFMSRSPLDIGVDPPLFSRDGREVFWLQAEDKSSVRLGKMFITQNGNGIVKFSRVHKLPCASSTFGSRFREVFKKETK